MEGDPGLRPKVTKQSASISWNIPCLDNDRVFSVFHCSFFVECFVLVVVVGEDCLV